MCLRRATAAEKPMVGVEPLGGFVEPPPADTCTCSAVQVSLDSGATGGYFQSMILYEGVRWDYEENIC